MVKQTLQYFLRGGRYFLEKKKIVHNLQNFLPDQELDHIKEVVVINEQWQKEKVVVIIGR